MNANPWSTTSAIRWALVALLGFACLDLAASAHANDTVSGTVYQSDRTIPASNGLTVAVVLNGSETATTDLADGNGTFSMDTGGNFADSTPFALYIKGETQDGMTFSVAGGAGNIEEIVLYIDHVTAISHDNRDLTNADIATSLSPIGSGDKICGVNASNDLTVSSGKHLFVAHGTTNDYSPSRNISVGGDLRLDADAALTTGIYNLIIDGDIVLNGTLDSSGGTLDFRSPVVLNKGSALNVTGGVAQFADSLTDTSSGGTDFEDAHIVINGNSLFKSNERLYLSSLTINQGYAFSLDSGGTQYDQTIVSGTTQLSGAAIILEDGGLYLVGALTDDADSVIALDAGSGGEIISFDAPLTLHGKIVTTGGDLDFNDAFSASATGVLDLDASTVLHIADGFDLTNVTFSGSGVTNLGQLTGEPAVFFDGTTLLTPQGDTTWPHVQLSGMLEQAGASMVFETGKAFMITNEGNFTVTQGLSVPGMTSVQGALSLNAGVCILGVVAVGSE